ncbi:MAG: transcription elongation factor GreA [Candidatus Saccharimonadales bacterium]
MVNNNGKDYRLTEEGLKKYQNELERLKSERQKVAQRLKEAKEAGDLSENVEWSSAMDDYKFVESHIEEVEDVLQHAQVVKPPKQHAEAQFGSIVTIKDGGPEKEYFLVGSLEADPEKDKISISSPVGQKLIGKKAGDTFQHTTPSGQTHTYEIKKIS